MVHELLQRLQGQIFSGFQDVSQIVTERAARAPGLSPASDGMRGPFQERRGAGKERVIRCGGSVRPGPIGEAGEQTCRWFLEGPGPLDILDRGGQGRPPPTEPTAVRSGRSGTA